jgi:hypothetical protein
MKILIEMGQSAAYHYRLGWANAFASAGNNVNYWNTFQKSAFDVFTEFEPDIFIGTTWGLNRAIIKCIAARPELKVLLSAPNWGCRDDRCNGFLGRQRRFHTRNITSLPLIVNVVSGVIRGYYSAYGPT